MKTRRRNNTTTTTIQGWPPLRHYLLRTTFFFPGVLLIKGMMQFPVLSQYFLFAYKVKVITVLNCPELHKKLLFPSRAPIPSTKSPLLRRQTPFLESASLKSLRALCGRQNLPDHSFPTPDPQGHPTGRRGKGPGAALACLGTAVADQVNVAFLVC